MTLLKKLNDNRAGIVATIAFCATTWLAGNRAYDIAKIEADLVKNKWYYSKDSSGKVTWNNYYDVELRRAKGAGIVVGFITGTLTGILAYSLLRKE